MKYNEEPRYMQQSKRKPINQLIDMYEPEHHDDYLEIIDDEDYISLYL